MSDKLREMLKRHEDLRLKPYKDSRGIWTVGYGHNLEAHGEPIPESISLEQAEKYLDDDIARARRNCELFIPGWDDLDEVRRCVLVDMCFNLGLAGLIKFRIMLRCLQAGLYSKAAEAMLDSLWATQVGGRATELSKMMETGEWQ